MEKIKFPYYVIGLIIILFCVGAYTVYDDHVDKAYLVIENKVKESARKCYLDSVCEGEITLNYLIDNNYLDVLVDPISKEEINGDMVINYSDNEVIFEIIR